MATFGNVTISGGLVMGSGSGTPTFSPNGGTTAGSAVSLSDLGGSGLPAEVTISCSSIATWTWSRTGSPEGTASIASGGSDTSITFTLSNLGFTTLQTEFSVVGTSGSVTRYWVVTLTNTGSQ